MTFRGIKRDDAKSRLSENTIGLIAGAGCLGLSELDPGWGKFWLLAGVVLILSSLISIYRGKAKT